MTAPTEVKVPDIGDFGVVPIIEVHVSAGDQVNAEDPLVTLESDKATMDIPAPVAGSVAEVLVKVGDEVSEGSLILLLPPPATARSAPRRAGGTARAHPPRPPRRPPAPSAPAPAPSERQWSRHPRRDTRRALGAAHRPGVGRGPGRGHPDRPKGRITKDDLLGFLKGPAQPAAARPRPARGIPEIPAQDFSKFGPIDTAPCHGSRKSPDPSCTAPGSTSPTSRTTTKPTSPTSTATAKTSTPPPRTTATPTGSPCSRSWSRPASSPSRSSPSSTPHCPRRRTPHPQALLQHRHRRGHPGGLVVPVVTDADRKGIVELSREFMSISGKARDGKLGPSDMAGGTFTISSLGGIGGTSFTPIVNAPEVAILGVVRSKLSPVWNGTEFTARNMPAFPVLRPPRHRRCAGRPLRPTPVLPARRRPTAAAVTAFAADHFDQQGATR